MFLINPQPIKTLPCKISVGIKLIMTNWGTQPTSVMCKFSIQENFNREYILHFSVIWIIL